MNEAKFAGEMKQSIGKVLGKHSYNKIPDQIYNPRAKFNPEKKYDAYVVYRGCHTSIEYKFQNTPNAFSFSSVRDIQRISLWEDFENGANAYIILGVRSGNIRKAIFIDIKTFEQYRKTSTRKSIPLNLLADLPQATWIGKGFWEFSQKLFMH